MPPATVVQYNSGKPMSCSSTHHQVYSGDASQALPLEVGRSSGAEDMQEVISATAASGQSSGLLQGSMIHSIPGRANSA